jgi:hypothetical protein
MDTGSCKWKNMVRYCGRWRKLQADLDGHVFPYQKERIKKRRPHLPGAKRGDKKEKTNGNRNK